MFGVVWLLLCCVLVGYCLFMFLCYSVKSLVVEVLVESCLLLIVIVVLGVGYLLFFLVCLMCTLFW